MKTIHVSGHDARTVEYRGPRRKFYVPRALDGTVCSTVALRAISGSEFARHPQDWPCFRLIGMASAMTEMGFL